MCMSQKVSRHQKGRDLARTIGKDLVAGGPSVEHKMDVFRTIPLSDDVGIVSDSAGGAAKMEQYVSIVAVEIGDPAELRYQRIRHAISSPTKCSPHLDPTMTGRSVAD